MNNYSPYEIKILLDIHAGVTHAPTQGIPLFLEAIKDFVARGLVVKTEQGYVAGDKLPAVIEHVLGAPRPQPGASRSPLTTRQREVFRFLISYISGRGAPPTRREIAAHFGLKSQNGAQEHLEALARKGYIMLGTGQRNLRVIP